MIFTDDPHRPGDIVEISMSNPGINGAFMDPTYTTLGIKVELEERFTLFDRVLWRAKFVDRLGSLLVFEEEIMSES